MDEQTNLVDLSMAVPEDAAALMPLLPDIQPEFETQVPMARKKKFITTMTLTSETCKWPFGDPVSPDFHYCGHAPQAGRPYCSTHEAISRPSSLRRK
ncbi:MAG TPA: GcrA family cell cycle regulator [Micropepsaceae bacterium]